MAKSAAAGKGSNLFALDHDAIRAVLRDANAALLARAERLAEALDRMPALLDSDALVERGRAYRSQLLVAGKELRQARLQDGRAFREADGVVRAFFGEAEARLGRIERAVQQRLTEAALRAQPSPPPPEVPPPEVRDVTVEGQPVALGGEVGSAAAAIRLRWEVAAVDRTMLDIEALRLFLTDAALLAACRKHLEENGPHSLPGVAYRQVAVE